MANIAGTQNNDVLQGTAEDDVISGLNGQDTISGEGGNDSILGGGGDDVLYGDAGVGTVPGNTATPLNLSINNLVSDSSSGNNNAQPNDQAIYSNIAQLEDGTPISGRLILVSTSDPDLNVDLSGGMVLKFFSTAGRARRGRWAVKPRLSGWSSSIRRRVSLWLSTAQRLSMTLTATAPETASL